MNIDSIKDGVVIDHIKAGNAMRIYKLLGFDKLECSVAIIKNVSTSNLPAAANKLTVALELLMLKCYLVFPV